MANVATTRTERTHRSIVDAAGETFLRSGFLGASMDDIAAMADVSKQTVYSHFQSKEALFLAVLHGMTGRASDTLSEQVQGPDSGTPLADFLLDFAVRQLDLITSPQLLRLRRLVIAEAERFPQLGEALYAQGPERSMRLLATAFAQYRAGGELVADDVDIAAAQFNWMVVGGPVNQAMFRGIGALPGPGEIERHARECVRIFLAAYRPQTRTGPHIRG